MSVPVVVLTGFLGSGKTTLLNRMLNRSAPDSGKLALIVNELGAVGIDGDLLPDGLAQQVEIPGGCICCQLDEDLEKTINQLLDSQPDLGTIVIETTGIAEPIPISWTLEREPLGKRVRLAAIVTVVDALEHERHRPLSPSVDAQVEDADILVVSKLDLLGADEPPAELIEYLRQKNSHAPVVFGDPDKVVDSLWQSLGDPTPSRRAQPSTAHHHPAANAFDSVVIEIENILDFEELTEQLEHLPPSFVRIKGVALMIDGSTGSTEPQMIAFHRVGARVSAEPVGRNVQARVVALGPGITAAPLAACINAAVVPSDGEAS
jgi:G3E family GTPase